MTPEALESALLSAAETVAKLKKGETCSFDARVHAAIEANPTRWRALVSAAQQRIHGHGKKNEMSGTGGGNIAGFIAPLDGEDDEKKVEETVRLAVRALVTELVRKKAGGGGYVLYSPNRGKKKPAKAVGEFPTRASARKAELARFPPKDAERLKKLRKEITRMEKDPEKRIERAAGDMTRKTQSGFKKRIGAPKRERKPRKESLQSEMNRMMTEALFEAEEQTGSGWDERLQSMSADAVASDAKLQKLQKAIEKSTTTALAACVKHITKALKSVGKVSSDGVKKDESKQKTYAKLSVDVDGVGIGPIYVYIENGKPNVEVSAEAKNALTRLEPQDAKALRAELVACQEDGFAGAASDIGAAIQRRDSYLEKLQTSVDDFLSDMTALELTVAKNLMTKKYRGKR